MTELGILSEDDWDDFMDIAYKVDRNDEDLEPFAPEEKIRSFVVLIENLLAAYPMAPELSTPKQIRDDLKSVEKRLNTILRSIDDLFGAGGAIDNLNEYSANHDDLNLTTPSIDAVKAPLEITRLMVQFRKDQLHGVKSNPNSMYAYRLAYTLALLFFIHFLIWPSISDRKPNGIQSPFTHFWDLTTAKLVELGHAKESDFPKDIKKVIRKTNSLIQGPVGWHAIEELANRGNREQQRRELVAALMKSEGT